MKKHIPASDKYTAVKNTTDCQLCLCDKRKITCNKLKCQYKYRTNYKIYKRQINEHDQWKKY